MVRMHPVSGFEDFVYTKPKKEYIRYTRINSSKPFNVPRPRGKFHCTVGQEVRKLDSFDGTMLVIPDRLQTLRRGFFHDLLPIRARRRRHANVISFFDVGYLEKRIDSVEQLQCYCLLWEKTTLQHNSTDWWKSMRETVIYFSVLMIHDEMQAMTVRVLVTVLDELTQSPNDPYLVLVFQTSIEKIKRIEIPGFDFLARPRTNELLGSHCDARKRLLGRYS